MAASRIPNPLGQGSSPWGYANLEWAVSDSGSTVALQASGGSSILPRSTKFLLGYSLVWPKALVFEISIIGSNPITPAKFNAEHKYS